MKKSSTFRLAPETRRQISALAEVWGESQAAAIARCVERAWLSESQKDQKMPTSYELVIGDKVATFNSLSELAAYANALDGDSGLAFRYYAIGNGERRDLTNEEYEELEKS